MTGVPVELAIGELVAGQLHLGGVDDDDVVAAIDMRREGRLVLAAQPIGDDAGEAAENQAVGVDDDPLLDDLGRPGGLGLHGMYLPSGVNG
jgi:hypothetical protein